MRNKVFISLSKNQLKELINHCDGFIPYHVAAVKFYQNLNKNGEYDEKIRKYKKKLKFFNQLSRQAYLALERLK